MGFRGEFRLFLFYNFEGLHSENRALGYILVYIEQGLQAPVRLPMI